MRYFIASCVFTSQFPELSARIQGYVRERFQMPVVRCCVPRYKIKEFEGKMPEGPLREAWQSLPDSAAFAPGDEVYSLCHNCLNIIEELHPGVTVRSLWELIDQDDAFPFPDHAGLSATVQDCWRSRDRTDEQRAVRSLLDKMNIRWTEAQAHHAATGFCGCSLYRAQPPRNPKLAPKHYVEGAAGKFEPHTAEEQAHIMREYCEGFSTHTVICYCHYCLEGLRVGGVDGRHIAELLFA
ncbi:MAG: hypothetical protein E7317_05675 [Clostridiales bacterium]|nr:hypothetical protein [Clostridiales bacterium]